jgi:hypothetical protein
MIWLFLACVHRLGEVDHSLAPPFTAVQLHDAFPAGTDVRFRRTTDGQTVILHWVFESPTDDGVSIRATVERPDGTFLYDDGAHFERWAELVQHAVFPAAATTIEEGSVTVAAGTYPVRTYVVRGADGTIERFSFAPTLPGPPVFYTKTVGGVEVVRMELVERR